MNLFKEVGKAYYRVRGYYPACIHGEHFKLDPFHIGFWRDASKSQWETDTYKILKRYLNEDSLYCDIGAWIGPTVIYAAKICKQVVCFEPDPFAYKYLRWNIDLNELDNVKSFNIALSNQLAIMQMSSFDGTLGDSTSSLLNKNKKSKQIDVVTLSWDQYIKMSNIGKIDFLKIDIEGGEFELIPTLKEYLAEYKPIVYLSTHAPFLDTSTRKAKLLQIIETLSIYKTCLNENMMSIEISKLSEEHTQSNFCSYLFMD